MADPVQDLVAVFGGESDDAFGSAVFRTTVVADEDLETVAKGIYRTFVGEAWTRAGDRGWLGSWAKVATRSSGTSPGTLELLRSIADPQIRSAADVLVDGGTDPAAARAALTGAFDRPAVSDLAVFSIGDGEAMSGLIISAREDLAGNVVSLAFLMD